MQKKVGTYMERMRATGDTSREGKLDGRVAGQSIDAPGRQEVRGGLGARHDLQQDRHGRRHERHAVDLERERGEVEIESEVHREVHAVIAGGAGLENRVRPVGTSMWIDVQRRGSREERGRPRSRRP
jgi:hypothetical protein